MTFYIFFFMRIGARNVLNHSHRMKYTEVTHAFCAANSEEIDYINDNTIISLA